MSGIVTVQRPRVAAIGLDDQQLESIRPLCGTLRSAVSPVDYARTYSWTETDVAVVIDQDISSIGRDVNVLSVGTLPPPRAKTPPQPWAPRIDPRFVRRRTERETRVLPNHNCPDTCAANSYRTLATDLSRHLSRLEGDPPPPVVGMRQTSDENNHVLISTTSGWPVAVRQHVTAFPLMSPSIVLLLPRTVTNLPAWFRVFLTDVHDLDESRVPNPPPRLTTPADWYTPEERRLADRVSDATETIERLQAERERLAAELASATETADAGIRRVLWAGGDELVSGVSEILTHLGFVVRDMDSELAPGAPKGEDLRLAIRDRPGWEAIVEVKGYTRGTKTNDARQIREQRDRYIAEICRQPDLTLWVANPHRHSDPSSRPTPDTQVSESAATIGAVHVLASDLYRQWALVADHRLQASDVVNQLINATPGCWSPEVPSRSI